MIVNVNQLNALRREAQQLAKEHPELYTFDEAKDRIARREGYSTWAVLLRQTQSPLSSNPTAHTGEQR